MSILLKKIIHYKEDGTKYNITNALNTDSDNGLDIRNNVLSVDLKNNLNQYREIDSYGLMPIGDQVNFTNPQQFSFRFEEGDQIKIWVKRSDDGNDINTSAWSQIDTENTPSNDYLLGVYFVKEWSIQNREKSSNVKIVSVDKTNIIFNKILAKTFNKSNSQTIPEMIKEVVLQSAQAKREAQPNTFLVNVNDSNSYYDIFAGLDTETAVFYNNDGSTSIVSGQIQSKRSDGSDFPTGKILTKIWKPVYEFVKELSQIEYINEDDELDGTNPLLYGNAFRFFVDENSIMHWFELNNTVDGEIVVGYNNDVIDVNLTKAIFDVKNMIIFNCGKDMNGHGILHYALNTQSNIKGLKMQYIPMTKIAEDLYKQDLDYTAKASRDNGGENPPQYPTSYGAGLNTAWSNKTDLDGETIEQPTDDSEYNIGLRKYCKVIGNRKAQRILQGIANARWKGTIEMKGKIWTPGSLLEITDTMNGIYKQKLRITDVRHTIQNTGWFTTLDVEEDETALISLT